MKLENMQHLLPEMAQLIADLIGPQSTETD